MIRSNQRRVSNIWKTLTIFLLLFTILSESYLIYKIINQDSELVAKRAEVQELLKIIHETNTGKFSKSLIVPQSVSKNSSIESKDLVTKEEFKLFKKEYSGKLKKLQRELNTLRKNSLLSSK